MADAPDKDQQTEAPTPRRKQKAKDDGDVLQSKEMATAVMMAAGAGWLLLAGPWMFTSCLNLVKSGLNFSASDFKNSDFDGRTLELGDIIVMPMASIFLVTLLASMAGPAMLGSSGFRSKAFHFKGSKINPISGLKRMFGLNGMIELGKALLKSALLGALGYWLLATSLPEFFALARQDDIRAASNMGHMIGIAVLTLTFGLVVIGGADVPIQMVRRTARLRMTKQQMKDEMRETDGAPELKQAVRQKRFDILSSSARKGVEEATVILTNPTHFSIALRYQPGKDAAPMVVARGRGDTALAIRELAQEKGVPLLEYPELTRAIYFTARVGQVISEELYIAVATVLAFVFNLEKAVAEGVTKPGIVVPAEQRFDEHGQKISLIAQ